MLKHVGRERQLLILLQGTVAMNVPFLLERCCSRLCGDHELTPSPVVPLLCLSVSWCVEQWQYVCTKSVIELDKP
jgi:hypothetical protein